MPAEQEVEEEAKENVAPEPSSQIIFSQPAPQPVPRKSQQSRKRKLLSDSSCQIDIDEIQGHVKNTVDIRKEVGVKEKGITSFLLTYRVAGPCSFE